MLNLNQEAEQREPRDGVPRSDQDTRDPLTKFWDHLARYDLHPKEIIPNDKYERFDIDKRGDKAGWYILNLNGDFAVGSCGSWKDMSKYPFCSKDLATMTPRETIDYRAQVKRQNEAKAAQEKIDNAEAKDFANQVWAEAVPVPPGGHPYLAKKGLLFDYGLKVGRDHYGQERLCVPTMDEHGQIVSLQYIDENGTKQNQPFGDRKGKFYLLPGAAGTNKMYIAEGLATAATIRDATGADVICAFTAGNIPAVAPIIRKAYPTHKITIAADDDRWKPERGNAGLRFSQQAANEIGVPMVYPKFTDEQVAHWRTRNDDQEKGPTDFNDLAAFTGGVAMVQGQLSEAPEPITMDIKPFFSGATGDFFTESNGGTNEQQFVFSRPGAKKPGGLRVGVIGYEGGEGGSGKTRIWFQILASIAYGHDFTGGAFDFYEIGPAYMVAGEDSRDIMGEISTMIKIRAKDEGFEIPKELQSNFHFRCVDGGSGSPCLFTRDGRNIVENSSFYGLYEDCKRIKPTSLVLDSQSVIIGMGEESNEDAGMVSGKMKVFLRYCKTIIIIAHTNKGSTQAKITAPDWNKAWPSALSVEALRGSSGMVFNGRYLKMTTKVPQRFNEELGAGVDDRLVACTIPKANGAIEIYDPFYFKQHLYSWKNNQGTWSHSVLWDYYKRPITIKKDQITHFLCFFKEYIDGEYTYSQMQNTTRAKFGKFLKDLEESCKTKFTSDEILQFVNTCMGTNTLVSAERKIKETGRPALVLYVDTPENPRKDLVGVVRTSSEKMSNN